MIALLHRILLFIFSLSLIASPTWAGVVMLSDNSVLHTKGSSHQMNAADTVVHPIDQLMTQMMATGDSGNHCQGHECHPPMVEMADCNEDKVCNEMNCATVAIVNTQESELPAFSQPSIVSLYVLSLAGTSKNLIRPPIA